jgi:hypothetical protein
MEELIVKFFWGEETRASGPEILKKVYEIAEREPDVKNHVPVEVFSRNSSTATIRVRLNLPTKGARVLYLIIFQKLMRITKLVSVEFLNHW